MESELKESTKKLEVLYKQLKKQQEEVVHPLIEQVKERETDVIITTDETKELKKSLRIAYAVIRVPKLMESFHKIDRKIKTQEEIKKANQDAHLILRQQKIEEANYHSFMDDYVRKIQRQILHRKQRVFITTVVQLAVSPYHMCTGES